MDKYKNFEELKKNEKHNTYSISYSEGSSGVAIIAPHGGGIEPGTSEIAEEIAKNEHTFYSFNGQKQKDNKDLHITSKNFDEPIGVKIVEDSKRVVAIHGWKKAGEFLCLGGLDKDFKIQIQTKLVEANFQVVKTPDKLKGEDEENICNRGKKKCGVQIELSKDFRDVMFKANTRKGRLKKTKTFENFVAAIRKAIEEETEKNIC